jgi:hypothetical protein
MAVPTDLIPGELDLVGTDGNAFAVIGNVTKALYRAGNSPEIVNAVIDEMMSGDYDHLLAVALEVTV